jgi:FkbM family methyltransferase
MILLKKVFWKLPRVVVLTVLKYRFNGKFLRPVTIKRYGTLIKLREITPRDNGRISEIYFYHPKRISRYFMGINERIDKLGREYCLDQIKSMPDGVIVDIGSNIGEFTLYLNGIYPNRKFLRFEPSHTENLAAQANLAGINQILIPKPCWSHITEVDFFNSNETGDSSIFKPYESVTSNKMQTTTLDTEVAELRISKIALIKLEAEGAEPEILLGAEKTLKITKFITADLGPERGLAQERTFSEVHEALSKKGFKLIAKNPGDRECYLFENMIVNN